jgi:hypothetical protein
MLASELVDPVPTDPEGWRPWTWTDIRNRVLVPEVCVTLIQEDLGIDRTSAIATFYKSRTFGDVAHALPSISLGADNDDDDDDDDD